MTTVFEVVPESASLLDAMRLLGGTLAGDEIGIKCIIVTGEGGLLRGILTQSDVVGEVLFPYFVRRLTDQEGGTPSIEQGDYKALHRWAARVRVTEVMTRRPVTVPIDASLFDVANTIVSGGVRSLPVLDGDRVAGVIYRTALYRCLADGILAFESNVPARGHSGPRGPSIGKSHDSAPALSPNARDP